MQYKNKIINGDSLEVLKEIPDNTFSAIVTDPPYGLSFMGKKWDYDVPSVELWSECLRVLKPGGHVLSFSGTRTYHRMVVNMEDAGFEVRDMITWNYGSGFPKSHNIGKAVDKAQGNEREVVERPKSEQRPNADKVRAEDNKVGKFGMSDNKYTSIGKSKWEGYGTALKPSLEPIVLARKPLSEKTIVQNCLVNDAGGLNIDESRIETFDIHNLYRKPSTINQDKDKFLKNTSKIVGSVTDDYLKGRFPANSIFDEEAGKVLDEQSGVTYGDMGGASRFFYCPKTSAKERNEGCEHLDKGNIHPTLKPIKLMTYLCNLLKQPENNLILDPFTGSGSTLVACKRLGLDYTGIEREKEYCEIAEARVENVKQVIEQKELF